MTAPKIIIVEDEMIIAQDIKYILINMGYDVPAVTGSGEDALQTIEVLRPDLVLMDIKLKGDMNGIEAAGQAHALFNVPVVYMTANADEKTVERAKKTEPYGFIYKPVQKDVLRAVIEMALYKHGMEKKLIDREARLRATLNSIGDAVISTDTRGRIIGMNPVAENLTGWPFEKAEGKTLTEVFNIVNAVTGKKAVNPVRKVLENGKIVGIANHTMLIAKDGTEYQIADSASPIISADGTVSGVVLVFRDVTEEYRARQVQSRLAAIVESSSDAVIGKLPDGTVQSWNRAAEQIFGYTAKEMIGESIFKLVPADLIKEEQEILKKIQQGVQIANYDTIRKTKQGKLIFISLTISPIRDENGKISGVSTIARDITKRKEAEERIKQLTMIISSARDVNQLITKEDKRDVLLKKICNILTKNKGYSNVLISLFDENQQFNFAAESGIGENFQILINDLKKGKLPLCIKNALNQREIFLIDSPEMECADCPVRVGNEGESAVSVRLEYNRKIYGVLFAKAGKNLLLDEEILELFKEVAGDIAHALYRLELEEAHKKAEATILENEQFLSSLFESIQDGISVLNPDLTIRHVNSLMNEWYKQNFPLEGKKCYEVYHNADKPCDPCPSLRCLKSGKTEINVVPGLPGSPVEWIELFSYPLKNVDTGETTGIIEFVRDITKRKKAEIALWESEEKYHAIFESTGTATLIVDEDTTIIDANKECEYITGYAVPELIGKSWTKFVYKDDLATMLNRHKARRKNPESIPKKYEVCLINAKGEIRNAILSIEMIPGSKRSIVSMIDITERKQTEQALLESEERLKKLSNLTFEGILIHNKGVVIDVNQSLTKMLGYTREEVIGKNVIELCVQKEYHAIVEENIIKSNTKPYEVIARKKDGTLFPIEVESRDTKIEDEAFRVTAVRDITERKKVEDRVKESEEKLRNFVDFTPQGIWCFQPEKPVNIKMPEDQMLAEFFNSICIECNDTYANMMGVSKEEILGLKLSDAMPDTDENRNYLREFIKNGFKLAGGISRELTKDGKEKYFSNSMVGVIKNGKLINAWGTQTDVTERKQAEEQIQRDLKEKEILLKEVHHRVKNNLSVIASLLSLQSSKISTKEQAIAAFKESRDRVYTMAMVQEKLYQSGNYSEINMKEYTETLAARLMQIYYINKNIVYNFNIEDITIDVNRAIPCSLILNELITNALKHAFKGMSKGEISISFHRLKNGQNELIVSDNGIGLPKDIEVKKSESLGIRLITILTEQLEGKLSIKVKNGTEFKVLFPVNDKC